MLKLKCKETDTIYGVIMKCPQCGNFEDKVVESRQNVDGTAIRRRRQCITCECRFTSYERIDEKPLIVVKRDSTREVFDADKIQRGVTRAIEKRPIDKQAMERLLFEIEDEVLRLARISGEITTEKIGELILKKLFIIDHVAYIRFASVYRKFTDVTEFVNEIERISKNGGGNN